MNTWKHCSVHGPGDENSWGCPECVRELRKAVAERDARIATLEKELAEWKESARAEAEEADKARERIAELEKVLVGASEYIEGLAKRTGVLHGNIPEIRKALGIWER